MPVGRRPRLRGVLACATTAVLLTVLARLHAPTTAVIVTPDRTASQPSSERADVDALLADSVAQSAAAVAANFEAAYASAHAAPTTQEVESEWALASKLVRLARGGGSGGGIDDSVEGSASPKLERGGPQWRCHLSSPGEYDYACLSTLANSVPVWDSVAHRFAPPIMITSPMSEGVLPPSKRRRSPLLDVLIRAATTAEDGATPRKRGKRRSAVESDPSATQPDSAAADFEQWGKETSKGAVDPRAELKRLAAVQSFQYANTVLRRNSRTHAGRLCGASCAGRSGACEFCGVGLCCAVNTSHGAEDGGRCAAN